MRTHLIMHKDGPPEFVEVDDTRVAVYSEKVDDDNHITYEGLGKLYAYVSDPGEDPEVRASVWLFVHPDLIEQIKERGERVTTVTNVRWMG